MMRRILLFVLIAALAGTVADGQAPPSPAKSPVVTDVQRLTLQNALLRVQLAESRVQLAQSEFERARGEAANLLTSLQVPGYTLDLQTFTYQKAPAAK